MISRIKTFLVKQSTKFFPKRFADKAYKNAFGRKINWENPKTLIETIYWLQLYTDTSLWSLCADKHRVKEWVCKKGRRELINPSLGFWSNPKDIDWESLPGKFVLKSNNGSGQIIFVEDKNQIDKTELTKKMRRWLKQDYGANSLQLHYTNISKGILAEPNIDSLGEGLNDYKIWCINGKPRAICVMFNRWKDESSYRVAVFDTEWNDITDKMIQGKHRPLSIPTQLPKPKSLAEMLEIAKNLSADFPQVRVDLYEIEGKPFFGELTFTSAYDYFTDDFNDFLGNIDISNLKKKKWTNKLPWYK